MSPRARKICFCIFLALVLVEFRTRFDFLQTVLRPKAQIIETKIQTDHGEIDDQTQKEKLSQREVTEDGNEFDEETPDYHDYYPGVKIDDLSDSKHNFNSSGIDTLVFLHMQKTGGTTLGRRLVDNIEHHSCQKIPRKKRKRCPRPMVRNSNRDSIQPELPGTWIFSRYSTGWLCGLHADWTELKDCVADKMNEVYGARKRNLVYITNLRQPVQRFLSEWKHVQRGATWRQSSLRCGGSEHSELNTKCYSGEDWINVSLEKFIKCDSNLAWNRQTRMLADLTQIGCYQNIFNLTVNELDRVMLDSAKYNLSKMRWFGLIEFQVASELLFEDAFQPLHFATPFEKWNSTRGDDVLSQISDETLDKIKAGNHLDVKLYEYAQSLFFQRYEDYKKSR